MSGERRERVLVLCTGNSARSQMAEGFIRHELGERYRAFSAGTHPQGLSPLAVQVMAEVGVDISGQRSKGVEEFRGRPVDVLITVCDDAAEECPAWLGEAGERRHLGVRDPEDSLEDFRRARDEVRERVLGYLRRRPA